MLGCKGLTKSEPHHYAKIVYLMRITSETLEINCKNIFLNQRREQQCCSLVQEHSDHVQTLFVCVHIK